MEKEKYYTPTIEEFHHGFEFKYIHPMSEYGKTNGWISYNWEARLATLTINPDCISIGGFTIKPNNIKVKYLDREDIESFGFKSIITKSIGKDHYTMGGEKSTHGNLSLEHDWLNDKITIKTPNYIRDGSGRFDDYIIYVNRLKCKNKSEFSRLLKQLSII